MKSNVVRRIAYTLLLSLVSAVGIRPAAAEPADCLSRVCEVACDVIAPVFDDVSKERVDPFVPDEFKIRDVGGLAEVQVGAVRCEEVIIDHRSIGETRWVFFRVTLSPFPQDHPKGEQDAPGEFNTYEFFLGSDNRDFIKFFRDEGADPAAMVYVKNLVVNFDEVTGKVTVDAPRPTPSPFTLETTLAQPPALPAGQLIGQHWGTGPDHKGWWQRGPDNVIDGVSFGVSAGTVETHDPGSLMAQVFCQNPKLFADPAGRAFFKVSYYTVTRDSLPVSATTEPPPC